MQANATASARAQSSQSYRSAGAPRRRAAASSKADEVARLKAELSKLRGELEALQYAAALIARACI
jgi:hypothetical protein